MLRNSLYVLGLLVTSVLMAEEPPKYEIDLSEGYRRERLDFSISGPNGKPNILSELTFKKVDVFVTGLRAKVTNNDYFLKAIGTYGVVFDGKAVDDDYLFDNRKGQFSHSTHKISGDYTADFALRIGKTFFLRHEVFFSCHFGYSAYIQKLRMRHGKGWALQSFFHGENESQKIRGLNSTYKSIWYGPEVGIGVKKAVSRTINLFANCTLLFPLNYYGKGNWNLRNKEDRQFKMTNNSTKSLGALLGIGAKWTFCKAWFVKAEYECMKFYAKGGHMRVHNTKAPMHKAHLSSNEVRLSLGYEF